VKPRNSSYAGNRKSRQIHSALLAGLLPLFILAGCAAEKPKLDRPFFPEAYHSGLADTSALIAVNLDAGAMQLNQDPDLNRRLIRLWENGSLNGLFRHVQPMSTVQRADIANLSAFLQQILRIFLVTISPREPMTDGRLRESLIRSLACDPMSNLEIRFLMSSNLPEPFSRKPLTMLLISAHELALQRGAEPVYPHVYSPFLRKELQLPPLRDLEAFNLFATKSENRVYSTSITGFAVCHQKPDRQQSKPAGQP